MGSDLSVPECFRYVKVVHAEQLQRWDKIPPWQDCVGYKDCVVSFFEWAQRHETWTKMKRKYDEYDEERKKLQELDTDHLEHYRSHRYTVPGSLFRRSHQIELPRPEHEGTVISCEHGEVNDVVLNVTPFWFFSKQVVVTYQSPSRNVHRDQINNLRAAIANFPDEDVARYEDTEWQDNLVKSKFGHPVIFISHRWEAELHPDESCKQLQQLKVLRNCFVIYDFTSFPQKPRTEEQDKAFHDILMNMDKLMKEKMIILFSNDYLERSWCLYEYIVGSMNSSIVADQVQNDSLVELRNWAATRPEHPLKLRLAEDGYVSMQKNFISSKIIESVNNVLPLFNDTKCTNGDDKEVVRSLLITHLKATLPPKMEYIPYMGDWRTIRWTLEELQNAFYEPLKVSTGSRTSAEQHHSNVPRNLEDAVSSNYRIHHQHHPIHWLPAALRN